MKARYRTVALLLAGWALLAGAARAESPLPLEDRLAQLSRWGTLVYVTAHPDDESAGIITYLARGLHARVVILCLTRGAGGQNQIGPELWEDLARVRTRELRRAAEGYGAEVRFLGAEDFGYSKSLEETLRKWNEPAMVAELVRQIRQLRPLAVISHWSGLDGGSAHHQAAGLLTKRAFALAGEPDAFPEQIVRGLAPWQPRYLLIRSYNSENADFSVPVDTPSPVPGKTYEELAWAAFQNHRSQGLHRRTLGDLRSFIRGYYLQVAASLRDGPPPPSHVAELAPDLASLPQLFPVVEFPPGWQEGMVEVVKLADRAHAQYQAGHPAEAALALANGARRLASLRRELPAGAVGPEAHHVRLLLEDWQTAFLRAAAEVADVRLEAFADRAVFTPGQRVWTGLVLKVGQPAAFDMAGFHVERVQLVAPENWPVEPVPSGGESSPRRAEYVVRIPPDLDVRQAPYPALRALALLTAGPPELELFTPVRGLAGGETLDERPWWERLDPRRLFERLEGKKESEAGPALEPVAVAPAVTLAVKPALRLVRALPGETTREVSVELESHQPYSGKTSVWLEVPSGWYTPQPQEVELTTMGRAVVRFSQRYPAHLAPGNYPIGARAGRGQQTFALARHRQLEASSDPGYRFEPATARVQVLDLSVPPGLRVGYIGFNDDPVPALLAQLGVTVDMLDERALATRRLEPYDAILVATRAYDYRQDLEQQTPRLLDYARAGGALVVEHQGRRWDPKKFAPYPAEKPPNRNLRVTNNEAPVKALAPDHPVLNFPNQIGPQDWQGWVHERGLYFWQSWSEEYTPILETADPGQERQRGSLLYARYGDGAYIYCGLALFRQVRAGVPGGVRLYLNLLSQSWALKRRSRTGAE